MVSADTNAKLNCNRVYQKVPAFLSSPFCIGKAVITILPASLAQNGQWAMRYRGYAFSISTRALSLINSL
jgi:hypothetical protein